MSFLNSLDITGSALTAERFRSDIILQNLANQNTTRTEEGGPYRRKQVVFREQPLTFQEQLGNAMKTGSVSVGRRGRTEGGVIAEEVVESQEAFVPVYDPTNPDADENGYVQMPNVNNAEEMVDLMAASRAYEANITALNITKSMAMKALEIGK
ncbi:flagellar basal body rod protein FlgC [Faecalicatena sp. AGMB00832]|uniref:Flagellar basal-body rod protein FlgC n=1 Tax=Faecalicatena faecalis TaxID=2726362 RepID=A0ABS6DAN5_9FIRM|nr:MULTISPECIES: flagellar basal body rod protein FlgC [Faecalicatena]MBU3878566.1 flagellar basal body rod protein FlgC [Faecalicatena faecalis]MCI6466636.1 flagellar basal body rod protein FlgC [Faecalicatena sp.]MDY5620610.1 flagellar basal body rod protein FlgC [Lachnospiraceae bacterium]